MNKLRRRFVTDEGLPIQHFQDKQFDYLLDLYDPLYGCKDKYQHFLQEVEALGGDEAFNDHYFSVMNKVVEHVKEKEAYLRFNDTNVDTPLTQIQKKELYIPQHHGKQFMSVDLKKANFHSMKSFDEELVDGFGTYEEWLSQFTTSPYMLKSKQFRQIIFGNLNPKRQSRYQRMKLEEFIQVCVKHNQNIMTLSADEIVMEIGKEGKNEDVEKELKERANEIGMPISVSVFTLKAQEPVAFLGYVKEGEEGTIHFKGVPNVFMAQAFKRYYGLPVVREDLAHFSHGMACHFDEEVR